MKYKFIPVNNDLDKAVAFANTLDVNNIKNVQKIKQKPFYVPTVEVIEMLQNDGWLIKGVAEQREKNRKVSSNYVQLHHPDFSLKNRLGKTEAVSSLTISNSCNGNKPLTMDLGLYRQVCSNGAITFDEHGERIQIKHTEVNYKNLRNFISLVNNKTDKVLESFGILQNKNMTVEEARKFAYEAAKLRHNEDQISDVVINDLLSINRTEDEGNDLWTVFNRIQENLTADINNFNTDIRLNKQLSAIADQYALAV